MLHLLYARFWHKVLHDLGHVTQRRAVPQVLLAGLHPGRRPTATTAASRSRRREVVEVPDPASGETTYTWQGQPVTREFGKIGKSLKNVVSPDEMFEQYGADTLRVYEMSMGPLELSKPWETRAVVGAQRFLQRLWRNVIDEETGEVRVVDAPLDDATARALHRTIDAVSTDFPTLGFNTAIARLIELNNALTKLDAVPREAAEKLGRHGRAAGPAHRRGAVAAAGPRRVDHLRARSRWPTRPCWSRTPSPASCRSRARCATGSRCRPTSPRTPCASRCWRCPRSSRRPEAGIRTVSCGRPKLVNVVPL